jgi:hypothetical protein
MTDHWTFDAVEGRLIEAMRFAWRDQSGSFPFAKDGPWHLMQRDAYYWDHANQTGKLADAPPAPRVPLSRAERKRMDDAVEWLRIVGDDGLDRVKGGDARLIILATRKLAAQRDGVRGQVRWVLLLRPLGLAKGAGMLRMRYTRAVTRIVQALDKRGAPVDLARDD